MAAGHRRAPGTTLINIGQFYHDQFVRSLHVAAISFKPSRWERAIFFARGQVIVRLPTTSQEGKAMVPFSVLIGLFILFNGLGHFHIVIPYGWWASLRLALSGMFLLTASAHWGKRRPDLIQMVPPVLPRPDLLVTATGILEILGAIGLIIPSLAHYAAFGLALLLIGVFPANVHAARRRLTIAARPVPDLWPRTVLQIVFLVAAVAVFLGGDR
jgi:uncharacterized membrane protein